MNAAEVGEPSMRQVFTRIRYAERRRIQQILHDGIQQELVALVAKLSLVRSSLARGSSQTQELINDVHVAAQRIVDDLRELSHGIYPSVLSDLGLVAAVEASARRVPIPVTVTSSTVLRDARFATEVEESAHFFVAEALANALKHARPTRVAINLTVCDGAIQIVVQDNGPGLPESVLAGCGLTALRERIEAVNGTFSAADATSGGTIVQARIPMPNDRLPTEGNPVVAGSCPVRTTP